MCPPRSPAILARIPPTSLNPARAPWVAACAFLALVGFAANSLLARAALAGELIDAAAFTGVRLASGALVLALIAGARGTLRLHSGSWLGAAALFAYAYPFSLAYLRIGAASGALILFGSVQATMIGWGLARGERPRLAEWLGLLVAIAGLLVLVLPGVAAVDLTGTLLMALAGISWGVYSLLGRGASSPLQATGGNFARTVPLALLLAVASGEDLDASPRGALLAAASGALASGLGYALWYAALPFLSAMRAATVQLLVPVLAAAGAVVLLGESPSVRLFLAAAMILGGVLLAIVKPGRR